MSGKQKQPPGAREETPVVIGKIAQNKRKKPKLAAFSDADSASIAQAKLGSQQSIPGTSSAGNTPEPTRHHEDTLDLYMRDLESQVVPQEQLLASQQESKPKKEPALAREKSHDDLSSLGGSFGSFMAGQEDSHLSSGGWSESEDEGGEPAFDPRPYGGLTPGRVDETGEERAVSDSAKL